MSPTIIHLREDPMVDGCYADMILVVTSYADDSYGGSGDAYALGKDGKFYEGSLSHNSYDGPLDDGWSEFRLDENVLSSPHGSSKLLDRFLEEVKKARSNITP
jgi:hypothetical protein